MLTELEQQMNDIVPKMQRKFGKTATIGLSVPSGPGSAGGRYRVFKTLRGFHGFWLGGGYTPKEAWEDTLKRHRKKRKGIKANV